MTQIPRSEREQSLVEIARRVLPAGGFGNMPGDIVIHRGQAGRIWDVSGNEYVDFLLGSGPMFAGHNHPEVLAAVQEQLPLGSTFFANSEPGIRLAAAIVDALPCASIDEVFRATERLLRAIKRLIFHYIFWIAFFNRGHKNV